MKKEFVRRWSKDFNLMLYHVLIATCIKKKAIFIKIKGIARIQRFFTTWDQGKLREWQHHHMKLSHQIIIELGIMCLAHAMKALDLVCCRGEGMDSRKMTNFTGSYFLLCCRRELAWSVDDRHSRCWVLLLSSGERHCAAYQNPCWNSPFKRDDGKGDGRAFSPTSMRCHVSRVQSPETHQGSVSYHKSVSRKS